MNEQALIVIDVQNDFCPGGALPVAGGHEIVPLVNDLIQRFDHVLLTQDWHPAGHSSFASTHPGKQPFETVQMPYGGQTLWPDHCIQGSDGAAFHPALEWTKAEMVIRKGFRSAIDSYSAFIEELTLVGLATDYCVAYSALDAVHQGFHTTVRLDACRAIDLGGSLKQMTETMREAGVRLV
jgi:nicotinamidase/pyrazinamidase